jgi:hypothetical protein
VDTSGVVAGLGGGRVRGRPPRSRTAIAAAFRYALAVSRRSDQPSRPQRQHVLSFVVVQDVAHRDVENTRSLAAVNVSVS